MNDGISIRRFVSEDSDKLIRLMQLQDERLHQLDGRLRATRSRETIQAFVAQKVTDDALVAVDVDGDVRAFALPGVWEVAEEDEMSGFFWPRNGRVTLTLPHPNDLEATQITESLLDAVEKWWQVQAVDGTLVSWPVADTWLMDLLSKRGYVWDSAAALRPLDSMLPIENTAISIRPAEPKDEEALVTMHLEEIGFHEAYTPYTRVVPAIEPAFRQRLARVWRNESATEGTPIMLVAEKEGRVVGFSENWLSDLADSWFPEGRYGYLNSVGVTASMRGQGVGRLLVAHTLQAFAKYNVAGYYLYYILPNPISSYFWPKMGFRPFLATFKTKCD